MHNESWSAFEVQSASLNKQTQAPHQPGSTAGNKFHHHASYDEFSEFKQLQTVTIMTHDYHGPPKYTETKTNSLGSFLGGEKIKIETYCKKYPWDYWVFKQVTPSNRPMGSFKPRPEVVASDPQATSTTLCRWVWYFHHK